MERNCVPNKAHRFIKTATLKVLLSLFQLSTIMVQNKSNYRYTTKRPSLTNTIKAVPGTPVRKCNCFYCLFLWRHYKLKDFVLFYHPV